MDGPVFKEGVPVHVMLVGMDHFQGLLDKAYLGMIDRKRLSKEDRARFYLRAQEIRSGSFHADLGVIFTGAQLVLPLIGSLGPTGIWEYAKQTYEFLKCIFSAAKEKQPITYTWNSDRSVVNVNTGRQTVEFNGPVFNIAQLTLPHYQALGAQLAPDQVREIHMGRGKSREITLDLPQRDLFALPSHVEETPLKLHCEIFDFNKFDNVGKLFVFEGESVKSGDYRFEVIGEQDVAVFIEAMLRKAVTVTCLRETAENPISGEKVVRLQIIKVET